MSITQHKIEEIHYDISQKNPKPAGGQRFDAKSACRYAPYAQDNLHQLRAGQAGFAAANRNKASRFLQCIPGLHCRENQQQRD